MEDAFGRRGKRLDDTCRERRDALAVPVLGAHHVAPEEALITDVFDRRIHEARRAHDLHARLTSSELSGGAVFRNDNCTRCHNGPSFSDGLFHDIGVPSSDQGRSLGASSLLADPFNGARAYSDDRGAGNAKLALVAQENAQEGAFRTASLRGVGQRTFFGHASHQATLRGFILDIYRRGGRGNQRSATVGALDPLLDGVNVDPDDVDDRIAFLHTLDCPSPPAELLAPSS